MNLDEFVAETLSNIIRGIEHAQSHVKEQNGTAVICPDDVEGSRLSSKRTGIQIDQVSFDVNVVADTSEKTDAGIGLIQVISFGYKKSAKEDMRDSQRITFSIPVIWPTSKTPSMKE